MVRQPETMNKISRKKWSPFLQY